MKVDLPAPLGPSRPEERAARDFQIHALERVNPFAAFAGGVNLVEARRFDSEFGQGIIGHETK